MKNERLMMARLAIAQLSRADRVALAKEFGFAGVQRVAVGATAEVRLMRRHEVARRLSVSVRTVDNFARQGLLTKRKLPGRQRASGFSSVEVDRFIMQVVTPGES